MTKKLLIFTLIAALGLSFVGCNKSTTPTPSGNCKFYISGIRFQDFLASGPVQGTVEIKFYTATDTSSSLIVKELTEKFTISNPNDHDQEFGYNLSEGIKKMEIQIYFDMGDYAAKKLTIENISLVHNGLNKYNEADITKSSSAFVSTFVLEPISIDF